MRSDGMVWRGHRRLHTGVFHIHCIALRRRVSSRRTVPWRAGSDVKEPQCTSCDRRSVTGRYAAVCSVIRPVERCGRRERTATECVEACRRRRRRGRLFCYSQRKRKNASLRQCHEIFTVRTYRVHTVMLSGTDRSVSGCYVVIDRQSPTFSPEEVDGTRTEFRSVKQQET